MTTAPQLPPQVQPAARPAPPASRAGYAKSRDTRARILAAALEEAGASGIHKASMAAIAARAGVAVGSLSYHFGSREELIRELMGQLMTDYLERVRDAEAAAAEGGGDYFARERAVLLAYVAHVRRHPAYVRLADEIKLHEPELYRRGTGAWTERMAGRIRAGIAEGVLRPMSEAEIALKASFLLGARHSLEQVVESDGSLSDEALVDAYLDLVRDGLGCGDTLGGSEAVAGAAREAS